MAFRSEKTASTADCAGEGLNPSVSAFGGAASDREPGAHGLTDSGGEGTMEAPTHTKERSYMLFSHYDRYQYAVRPLVEVICQLRFPAILSIGAREPVEFQEAVRHDFPRYSANKEVPAPTVRGAGTPNPTLEQGPAVTNYSFVSADGFWKLNLTSNFIAISTLRYERWEDFTRRFDKPLAAFIQRYEPAFFERIGLRYVNAFSRKALGMEETPWSDLIQPAFLGVLAEPDVEELPVTKCALDVEMGLEDGLHLKLHSGPGLLGGGKKDPEVKFILDGDFSTAGNFSAAQVPGRLDDLHYQAVRLFRGALTSELHSALGATPLA